MIATRKILPSSCTFSGWDRRNVLADSFAKDSIGSVAADERNGLYRVCVRPPCVPLHDLCLISLPHPRIHHLVLRVLRVPRVLRLGSVKIGPNPEV